MDKKCVYCGQYSYGIDRKDNSKGYIEGNLVSCCTLCNWMKLGLTAEQFINHCKIVSLPHPEDLYEDSKNIA